MVKAIQFRTTGGPEVLKWEDVEVGKPGRGEARVVHRAIGLNFIDCYFRSGLYPMPGKPSGVGVEASGVVEAVGAGVKHVKAGDRVAYVLGPLGAYAEARLIPAEHLVKLPRDIDFETAAAAMLKGTTAQYLIRRTYKVNKGDTVLFHAAAGGVGLIACQWLKARGAKVIGTVGTEEKAKIAKRNGCWRTVNYNREDFVERVNALTKGAGVPVVYDSVGKDTFNKSLECLAPLGVLVLFGQSSGPVPPFNVGTLARGSHFVTRPGLGHYIGTRAEYEATCRDLFKAIRSGAVKMQVHQRYDLRDAAQAHQALESRQTTGATLLIP